MQLSDLLPQSFFQFLQSEFKDFLYSMAIINRHNLVPAVYVVVPGVPVVYVVVPGVTVHMPDHLWYDAFQYAVFLRMVVPALCLWWCACFL